MEFQFATTSLIVFGEGTLDQIGSHAARFGTRACLVTGRHGLEATGTIERAMRLLAASHVSAIRQVVDAEPDSARVDACCRAARAAGCEVVIGLGGGSVLDTAKAVAALLTNGGEAIDYLEVVGRGKQLAAPAAPCIAVPSTAGTGAEVTRNSVITDLESGTKASMRHECLLPRVALLDPTLTHSMPPEVTAATGLDALIQLIEPYVSNRAHPMIDALALPAIGRAWRALPRAHADGGDAEARADMMLAANWSGMALTHRGLGAAHAFAGPLGGAYPIAHGMACAVTMPHVMAANLHAAEHAATGEETIRRYADVAVAMGLAARPRALDTARAGADAMLEMCRRLRVPSLRSVGVTREAIPDLVLRAKRTSSIKANPVPLDDEALAHILEQAMD